ncbi:hypothetical protein ADK52_08285 [Streptomyces sp. WM6372]|uniref:helix-turn-helix domain-containing protein n=1 Tax=Streptomyces sp. WM6372 TaxID=1415555 RepID=UPI0006AF4950|nr:TetR/AcrR family transcriptional regulator [Streptomyces sp. WM6372]KOU27451.1 hypothetical protein ADK52_08285 [Streptomyces sp. WM6372]
MIRRPAADRTDRMFARRGAAVTLNEIAREAGIGVGTVYRRFPDVQALVTGADVYAFLHMIGAVGDRTHDIDPEAWRRYAEALLIGFGLDRAPAAHTSAMTDAQIRRTWPEPGAHQRQRPARDPEGPAGRAPGLS